MTPPKRRDSKNSDLTGTNIKANKKNGKTYYYYSMPNGDLEPLKHGDRQASIEAAIALNKALCETSSSVVDRILNKPVKPTNRNPSFITACSDFESEHLEKQDIAPRTLKNRRARLKKYKEQWPVERTGDIDTFEVAQFLREQSPEAARQHIIVLNQLWNFIASEGFQTQRPMEQIEKIKQPKRKRARHTWEGHRAIYDASHEWLQVAIDAALYSLQRRSDLVTINIDKDIDLKKHTITVLQQKSQYYDEPVYIDIKMGRALLETIRRSKMSGINCPYLIHYRPGNITKKARDAKLHPFAVTADYLSKQYAKVRDEIGVYDHLPKAQRPGFHSLRALGIFLLVKAGHSNEYVMALAGHADERMKAHYYEGHEKQQPIEVASDIDINFDDLDMSDIDWATLNPQLQVLAGNEN